LALEEKGKGPIDAGAEQVGSDSKKGGGRGVLSAFFLPAPRTPGRKKRPHSEFIFKTSGEKGTCSGEEGSLDFAALSSKFRLEKGRAFSGGGGKERAPLSAGGLLLDAEERIFVLSSLLEGGKGGGENQIFSLTRSSYLP